MIKYSDYEEYFNKINITKDEARICKGNPTLTQRFVASKCICDYLDKRKHVKKVKKI